MKSKDEVFNKLKEFKVLIENHTEKKINIFRSDNGGEFTSEEFKEFRALIENHTKHKIKPFQSDNGGEFTSNELKELCRD